MKQDVLCYDREGNPTGEKSLIKDKIYNVGKHLDVDIVLVWDENKRSQMVILKYDAYVVQD